MALLASPLPVPLLSPISAMSRAVQRLRAWPVESQQTARRNAMIACTSLTQRRIERQEVHDFLASFYGTPNPSRAAAHG